MDVQQLFTVLKKEAECPLCLETVNNPKTLPCIHSFCLECLDKHANFARKQLQATIKCPVCQTSFQIPEGDSFKNLPASYHLNRLVDVLALKDGGTQTQKCSSCDENNTAFSYCFVCQVFLCTACFEAYQRLKTTRGHRNVAVYKSGTGTRGRGHRDACVGTWDFGTRDEGLKEVKYGTRGRVGRGRGDVKCRDAGEAGCE